eukprot:GGOE01017836.1.p1 GENE.GGOE01017836.1~~GGOE01017836.1.p1  ORF type:complete len:472 (+),score=150.62 GGOE01017836.1:23-1417(+)
MASESSPVPERATFRSFVPQHHKFTNLQRDFSRQYSHLYFTRLAEIQRQLGAVCLERWKASGVKEVVRILDIQPGVPCICVGTLYKDMALKPNFLADYLQNVQNARSAEDDDDDMSQDGEAPVEVAMYHSAGDSFILEDESGRMTLEGKAIPPHLVTGLVIGVKGVWHRDANFVVDDLSVCGAPPQPVSIPPCVRPETGPCYLALISGLNVGSNKPNPIALQLMLDFLCGDVGDPQLTCRIARVVVAGNSIFPTDDIKSKDKIQLHSLQPETTTLVDPMKEVDLYLAELCSSCPVDIVPGDSDPSNCFLPQQPLHPCLLPHTSKCPSAHFTTNPYEAVINGLTVLGTAGQNVDDIYKYASFSSTIDILESTVLWRNMAPTAPDTLSVYPFLDHDPFNLMECPHVYFAGNQPTFATRMLCGEDGQRCRLVCVPAFSESPCIVLVDLNSEELTTTPVAIGTLDTVS